MKIIIFKKKKMKLIIKEQQESFENANICYISEEKFENTYLKDKKDHCHYRDAVHSICKLKYSVPKKNPIAFND